MGKPSPWADIVTSAKKAQWDNAWWQDPAMTEYDEAEKKYGEIMPWIADELVRADKMLQQARTPQDTEQIIINMIHEFKFLLGDGPKEHQEISGYVNNWLEYHHLFTDQQGEDEGGNMGTLSSKEWEEVAPEDAFPSSSLGKYLKYIDKGINHKPAPKTADYYHLAPTTERDRIQQHGLMPSYPEGSENWQHLDQGYLKQQPTGVYAFPDADYAEGYRPLYRTPSDIWQISDDQTNEVDKDPKVWDAVVIPHPVQPVLHTPYENSADFELKYKQPKNQTTLSYREIFAKVVYENYLATQKKIDSQA